MEHINRVELQGVVGNVRRDGGMTFVTMATSHAFTSRDGHSVIETTWHRIVCMDEIAIERGETVHVKGRIRMRRYVSASGEEHAMCEIVASEIGRAQE